MRESFWIRVVLFTSKKTNVYSVKAIIDTEITDEYIFSSWFIFVID